VQTVRFTNLTGSGEIRNDAIDDSMTDSDIEEEAGDQPHWLPVMKITYRKKTQTHT